MIGHHAPLFLQGLAAAAEPRLAEYNPIALSSLCFALGKAQVPAPHFYATLVDHLPSRLSEFGARELSGTLLACMRSPHELSAGALVQLLDAFTESAVRRPWGSETGG